MDFINILYKVNLSFLNLKKKFGRNDFRNVRIYRTVTRKKYVLLRELIHLL